MRGVVDVNEWGAREKVYPVKEKFSFKSSFSGTSIWDNIIQPEHTIQDFIVSVSYKSIQSHNAA